MISRSMFACVLISWALGNSEAAESLPQSKLTSSQQETSVSFFRGDRLVCTVTSIRDQYQGESQTMSKDGQAIILSPTQFILLSDINSCNGKTKTSNSISPPNATLIDIDVSDRRFVAIDQVSSRRKSYVALLGKIVQGKAAEATEIYADCVTNNYEIKRELGELSDWFKLDCLTPKTGTAKSQDFSMQVGVAAGDLNRDGKADRVLIMQDPTDSHRPYRVEVYFTKPDGTSELAAASTSIISPEYPDGIEGRSFPDKTISVTIKNGVIALELQFLHGRMVYKFRFQNGNFELIGYLNVSRQAGLSSMIDHNLSTGVRIEWSEDATGEKIFTHERKRKILISPLPKIQDIAPWENSLY